MKIKRFFQVFTCFLLICCILINCSPIRAKATSAGLAASGAWVAANADIVIPSLIAALGVWAGVESGLFETVVQNCTADMKELGYVEEDQIQAYIADGKSYVGQDLIEAVRDWLFDEQILELNDIPVATHFTIYNGSGYSDYYTSIGVRHVTFGVIGTDYTYYYQYLISGGIQFGYSSYSDMTGTKYSSGTLALGSYSWWNNSTTSTRAENESFGTATFMGYYDSIDAFPIDTVCDDILTSYDLTLGNLAPKETPIASGYSTWYENAYVIEGTGGSGDTDPDDDGSKSLLPLTILAAGTALTLTQDEAQTGDTDLEPETDTDTETDPETDPTTAPGSESDPEADPDANADPVTATGLSAWLQNIMDAITGLPAAIGDLFTPSAELDTYTIGLRDFFPFCIPFDLYDLLSAFKADPVTPSWDFSFDFGELGIFEFTVDLHSLDEMATIARMFQVVVFTVMLAAGSKKLLGW